MSFATESHDPLERAHADVATARAVLKATRRRVAAGEDGAASLAVAEYRVNAALRRVDALGWEPPTPEPPDPYGTDWDAA